MKYVVTHYKDNYDWVKEYTDDFEVYDKNLNNVGYNIYPMMDFIVKNYEKLPEFTVFVKDNMLQRHITKEEFDKICNNTTLTPILTFNHETTPGVSFYKDGLYWEKNTYWYVNELEMKSVDSFAKLIGILGVKGKEYLPFAPGACWIVPKENILKQPKEMYEKLRDAVSYTQLPAEAHLIERALYTIWS